MEVDDIIVPKDAFNQLEFSTSLRTIPSQVFHLPFLKRLYCLLFQMSSDMSLNQYDIKDSGSLDVWNHQFVIRVAFSDISSLSFFLFKEVHRQFEDFLQGIGFNPVKEDTVHLPDVWGPLENFTSLLRSCMAIFPLLEFDQSLLLEKTQILLSILEKLCSLDFIMHISCHNGGNNKLTTCFKRLISHERSCVDDETLDSIIERIDASVNLTKKNGFPVEFVCAMVEVFIDELVLHHQLRKDFIMIDTILESREKVFTSEFSHGDIGIVLELISIHFLLYFATEKTMEKFPSILFWCFGNNFKISELTMIGAMSLLSIPGRFDIPCMFQAYMISIISECIGIDFNKCDSPFNLALLNNYLSAFEQSALMYDRCMSNLPSSDSEDGSGSYSKLCMMKDQNYLTFQSYIRPITLDKLEHKMRVIMDTHSCLPPFSRNKNDLMINATAYIRKHQHILDGSLRNEACSILTNIISMALSGQIVVSLFESGKRSTVEETFLLASILKLLGCSLLQSVRFMNQDGQTPKHYHFSEECLFITSIITRFERYNLSQPIQRILYDALGRLAISHKETKLMLIHFVGWLSSSFNSGCEFLWKNCLFVMMAFMNLITFEDGNLDAVRSLIGRAISIHTSSQIVASKIQKIQMLHLFEKAKYLTDSTQSLDAGSSQRTLVLKDIDCSELLMVNSNTCNGEAFIRSIKESNENPSEYDDLLDFIECKPGKDYSDWLKQREKYRKWKFEKRAILRRQRKKRTWRYSSLRAMKT